VTAHAARDRYAWCALRLRPPGASKPAIDGSVVNSHDASQAVPPESAEQPRDERTMHQQRQAPRALFVNENDAVQIVPLCTAGKTRVSRLPTLGAVPA
jgi:hypothetical protein